MFSKTFVALAVASSALAQITINTPTLAQCIPSQLTWTGGTAPYTLAVQDGSNPGSVIEYLSPASGLTGDSYSWAPVNLQAGRSVSLRLTDSTGAYGQSGVVVIQAGQTDSCLNSTASTSVSGSVSTTITTGSTSGSGTAVVGGGSASSASGASTTSASRSMTTSMSASMTSASASMTSAAATSATSAAASASKSGAAQANFAAVPAVVGVVAVGLAALF